MSKSIRESLVSAAKLMYEKGMVNAFEGNLSVRSADTVYITPSAICKGFLTDDMIVTMDLAGNVQAGEYKASSEHKLHLAAYRSREDVSAVVHAHPPFATAFAVANKPIETRAYPEMMVLYGKVPLVAYGTPSTDRIWQGLVEVLPDYDVVLLANHGVVAVGTEVFEAYFRLESVESIAKTLLLTRLLGGEHSLPDAEVETLHIMGERTRTRRGSCEGN